MLWNIVFNFFVQYIFGGYCYDSNGDIIAYNGFVSVNSDFDPLDTSNISLHFPLFDDAGGYEYTYLPLGNYLSLLATIITMVIIVVLCGLLIKKIYNICAHVIC